MKKILLIVFLAAFFLISCIKGKMGDPGPAGPEGSASEGQIIEWSAEAYTLIQSSNYNDLITADIKVLTDGGVDFLCNTQSSKFGISYATNSFKIKTGQTFTIVVDAVASTTAGNTLYIPNFDEDRDKSAIITDAFGNSMNELCCIYISLYDPISGIFRGVKGSSVYYDLTPSESKNIHLEFSAKIK